MTTTDPEQLFKIVRSRQQFAQSLERLGERSKQINTKQQPDPVKERELEERLRREREEVERKLKEGRALTLIGIMKRNKWENIIETTKSEIIEEWKKKHPQWIDRENVFTQLTANHTGSEWSYINNVIASTSQITVPPRIGTSPPTEDIFYGSIYPTAACIVWWGGLYGVTLLSDPYWYTVIYGRSITQNAALVGNEVGDSLSNNKWGLYSFGLAAVAIGMIVLKVL